MILMEIFYLFLPILKALNITARLNPISPTATANHRATIPGNAKIAKEPLINIEAKTFCFTIDIVFLLSQ